MSAMGGRKLKDGALPFLTVENENINEASTMLVCRVCLAMDVKMYDVSDSNMHNIYNELIGIYIIDERLPQHICFECAHRLKSCQNFKSKAMKSRDLLLSVLGSSQILTMNDVKSINRIQHNLKSSLQTVNFEPNTYYLNISYSNKSTVKSETELEMSNSEQTLEVKDENRNDLETKSEVLPNDMFYNEFADEGLPIDEEFYDSEDEKLLIDIKSDKPKKGKRKKVKEKVARKEKGSKKCENKNSPDTVADKYKTTDVVRRRKTCLNPTLFTVVSLSYEEQRKEIENRQESSLYKNAPYKCTVCYRGFPFKERYDTHVIRHTEQSGSFECFICKSRLKTSRALRKHVTAQHTEQYICKGCPFSTRNRGVAREHEKWHSGTRYQCPHCPMTFEKLTSYMGHVRIKHVSEFVCVLCGYTFVSEKGVHVHLKKKHRLNEVNVPLEGPHCAVCDVTFVNDEAHSRHMKLSSKHSSDHDPDRIRNDSQSKRPATRTRDPERRLPSDRPHEIDNGQIVTCEQCGIELRGLRTYAQHFRRCHPDKNRTLYPPMKSTVMCELCGRIFQSMALLKDHMWVHTGVKRFQCSMCDKSFTQKTNLVLHMKAHSSSRPSYPCHVCGKRFLFCNNRRRHMFIHTGLKPHTCTTCGKCFTTQGEMKAHVAHVHLKKPWPRRPKPNQKSIADTME